MCWHVCTFERLKVKNICRFARNQAGRLVDPFGRDGTDVLWVQWFVLEISLIKSSRDKWGKMRRWYPSKNTRCTAGEKRFWYHLRSFHRKLSEYSFCKKNEEERIPFKLTSWKNVEMQAGLTDNTLISVCSFAGGKLAGCRLVEKNVGTFAFTRWNVWTLKRCKALGYLQVSRLQVGR